MKNIQVSRKYGVVNILLDIDLNTKKSLLKINEKNTEERFTKILNMVNKLPKFNELSLNYNEVDYFDNSDKGMKKTILSYQEHGCIPNNWSESFSLSLDNPKTIKPIEMFLNEFGIVLNNQQIKDIRKAIKGESIYISKI